LIAHEPNQLLWGDLHVHTSLSQDVDRAVDPDTAYRWAKGLPVVNPYSKAKIQLEKPLDFLVVADYAEKLGETQWNDLVEAAERHYSVCEFTTFIGWEWSAELFDHPLHRIVFMDRGADQARQLLPFSALDSSRPEDLWRWLEETSSRLGTDFIAVPHSSNLSGGMMFPGVDSDGQSIDAAYARLRARWELVAEVTQIEGDAETHPELSPDDEFADFEAFVAESEQIQGKARVSAGSYARTALLRGLEIGQSVGVNPFQFGFIGSTGSHIGLASAEENNFWGAPLDTAPNESAGHSAGQFGEASAQGLTAVWAEENTRTSIFEAFKRREVYATTGPRIRVRFFGGWSFDRKQASKANMVHVGYTFGHPMGSNLKKAPGGKAPGFLMYAVKDPDGANLDRIQLVKGWMDAQGKTHEKVYDVVWSGGREREPGGGLPPIENTVDLETAKYDNTEGAAALHGFWSDPEFDPELPAFYYLRVLQIPTPRHTLYDAVAFGVDPSETGYPPTIQERAYTSPIWYAPQ